MVLRVPAASFAVLAMIATTGLTGAEARTSFDGRWSVLIVTEKGDCDRAYRYAVQVADGALKYVGEGDFQFTGKVTSRGHIQAKLSRGDQSASATGRLSGTSGAGTWVGRSPQKQCSGRWQAERR